MLRAPEGWRFEPIACDLPHYAHFLHCAPFGGSLHRATLDIRRRAHVPPAGPHGRPRSPGPG
ncbi:hypothetical protein [Streptomyces finlayi]|uniref:hypothetical protein n=1 Tax=Streptomyces finlayi TaxID=67296 RepID=UPI0035BBE416